MKSIILFFIAINLSVAHGNYFKVNDYWGYYAIAIDNDGCKIYEARNINGDVIIRSPIYRISNFIFTLQKDNTCL